MRTRGLLHIGVLRGGLGCLAIGGVLVGIAMFMGVPALQEIRTGRGLVATGEPGRALVVTADRVERSQCPRSQRALCTEASTAIGTVVYQVAGLRAGTDIRLTSDEYEAYVEGGEVFVDLIYLPAHPPFVERTPGQRLSRAQRDMRPIYILAAIGLSLAAIGGAAMLVARKQAAYLSTGPDR